jgi:WD40 repeat protein
MIRFVSASEDGQYLDVALADTLWQRLDAHTGRVLNTVRLAADKLRRVQFCERKELWAGINGQNELEVTLDGLEVWHRRMPQQSADDTLVQCALYPHRNQIVVASMQGSLWFLTLDQTSVNPSVRYSVGETLADAKGAPVGDLMALVTSGRQILLWDTAENRLVRRLSSDQPDSRFTSWSANGQRLVTYGDNGATKVWDVNTGELVRKIQVAVPLLISAELSFDGKLLAVGDGELIRVCDVDSEGEVTSLAGHRGLISSLQFADNGRTLYSGDTEGELRRWSITDCREVWSAP